MAEESGSGKHGYEGREALEHVGRTIEATLGNVDNVSGLQGQIDLSRLEKRFERYHAGRPGGRLDDLNIGGVSSKLCKASCLSE